MTTLTIDFDSITVILASDEIEQLGGAHRAVRLVAEAMQRVADAHGIEATIEHDATSGKRRGEDEMTWEHLAITLVAELLAEVGIAA